jgi:hypothetical protein
MNNNSLKSNSILMLGMAFLFFTGCKHNDKIVLHDDITSFSKFPSENNISFKELYEYNKGNPKHIYLVDSTLIIFNRSRNIDSFFYNYSLKNNQLSKGYLKVGRGPNEAIGAFCAGVINNNLWAFDLTLQKMFTTNKEIAIANNNPSFNTFKLEKEIYEIAVLDSSRFLINGMSDSKFKIQEIDNTGKILNQYGEFTHIPQKMPLNVLKEASHSRFLLRPSGGKFAVSYSHTDILEIYDVRKQYKSIAIQGPSNFNIDFKVNKKGKYNYFEYTNETKKAFLAGSATDRYIYLIYSGANFGAKNDWNCGKYIYVYDWNGNPIKKLNLDRRISGLAVSKDDKTMYSYDADKGFLVEAKIN